MIQPLVSIIIPTYNRAAIIGKTLQSIIDQTHQNWECIIIDDGSDDNSEKQINKWILKDSRFQFYNRPKNIQKGPSACRNYGFTKSNGAIINWFDSDDIYLPNALEEIVNQFDNDTDVVVCQLDSIDSKSSKKIKTNRIFSQNSIQDYYTGKIAFYVCGPFWKKKFIEKQTQLFDENIFNLDDWDFNLRMLYQNPTIKYYNKSLIQYIHNENSLSQQLAKLNFKEIKSEFIAREKQFKIIKENKKVDLKILKFFLIKRYTYFYREAMVKNDVNKYFLFKRLVLKKIEFTQIMGLFQTIIGFVFYIIFKKGYKFLK